MRCKKHLTDYTSTVGVCATCLTERLTALIDAQTLLEAQLARSQELLEDRRSSDASAAAPPPPLAFPRSTSPYISHRKSDYSCPNFNPKPKHHRRHTLSEQLFYYTPQVGPAVDLSEEPDTCGKHRWSNFNSCLLSRLFRFRSRKSSSSNRPSWFSNVLSSPGKTGKDDEASRSSVDGGWRPQPSRLRRCDRGLSPARVSDCCGDEEKDYCDYSAEEWKQTPPRATPSQVRGGGGHARSVSGLKFCLSPLVRASPSRQWNQKGMTMPPSMEVSIHGDLRVPAVGPRLSTGELNRSRKIADFGRCHYGHR